MPTEKTFFEQVPLSSIRQLILRGNDSEEAMSSDDKHGPEALHADCDGLKYPSWQGPLQEALLEFDKNMLAQRVALAETAIGERMQALSQESNFSAERQALADALSSLRILKREPSSFPD